MFSTLKEADKSSRAKIKETILFVKKNKYYMSHIQKKLPLSKILTFSYFESILKKQMNFIYYHMIPKENQIHKLNYIKIYSKIFHDKK